MDLSSLEGPPIPDSSFNVRTSAWVPRGTEIPRIHLDPTPSTPALTPWAQTPYRSSFNYDDYPPRPASSGSTALRRYYRNQDENPEIRRRSYNDEPPGFLHPPSSSSNGYSVSESDLSNHHAHSNGPRCRNTLFWCETQQTWLAHERHTPGNTAPALSIPQSQFTEPYHTASRGLGQSQSQSRDRYMDSDDMPPPYENHYYDRILAAQPMLTSNPQYQHQNRRPRQVSRWGAIARRMNRSPGP
ncbi:uncharacterized protein EURHEDRAFT_85335 [Aspergillus ruber CBS 135680]|uniref:Uncharacterized protein n=1 Tax=Aspergillus ruber (strain CBS 135680) TaxID=1388766 RepID=A0A017SC12_ASPRC|nr:uncharacterized protein EURHEDRAFT_85335 [Aspergillus ruber CBS 135680]EYE94346.1 hypothetical protein EURHEDRAFT_85335 [Aspergillus ruber CBS 135680]